MFVFDIYVRPGINMLVNVRPGTKLCFVNVRPSTNIFCKCPVT